MLVCRVVCRSHQSDRRIGYVSRTNQTAALRCVFRTNHITAFRYHAPITVFEYCFLVNDVMESWGCAQRMTLTQSHVNSCILSRILHTEGKVQIGNNQSRSPLGNIMYLPSHEIAIYIICSGLLKIQQFPSVFAVKLRGIIFLR